MILVDLKHVQAHCTNNLIYLESPSNPPKFDNLAQNKSISFFQTDETNIEICTYHMSCVFDESFAF